MGRRKKKATASLSDKNNGTNPPRNNNNNRLSCSLSLEFLDLLVTLFGIAGFYNDNANNDAEEGINTTTTTTTTGKNNSRRLLVSSLENLSMQLMKLQQQQQQVASSSSSDDSSPWPVSNINHNSANNNETDALLFDFSILLQLEEQLVMVREQVNVFFDTIANDRAETIHIKREIEALAATVAADNNNDNGYDCHRVLISWTLVATRLTAAILSELHVEECIARNLQQSLDSFYSGCINIEEHNNNNSEGGGGGNEMLNMIRHAVSSLSHQTRSSKLPNSLVYQEAAIILSKFITQAADDDDDDSTASSWTRLSYATIIDMTKPNGNQAAPATTPPVTSSTSFRTSSTLDPMRLRLLDHTSTTLTPLDVVRDFCAPFSSTCDRSDDDNDMVMLPSYCTTTTFLLLVGSEGSGKTFTCDEMERFASAVEMDNIHVIRPCLPMDFLGRRVGETEDAILSLYGAIKACSRSGPTLVLLDNIDYLFINNNNNHDGGNGNDDNDDANSRRLGNQHLVVRTQATFKEVMELLRHDNERQRPCPLAAPICFPILILGTARRNVDDSASALFDRVFFLEPPNELQRRQAIAQYLGIFESSLDNNNDMNDTVGEEEKEEIIIERLLSSLAQATIGKSYSELAQCCRQAIHQAALLVPPPPSVSFEEESSHQQQHQPQPTIITILRILQEQLHHKTPESLRSALVHDVVDMCVWTAQDLQSSSKGSTNGTSSSSSTAGLETTRMDNFSLGLYGPSIEAAWKELQHSIVIPLCQRRALSELLDCHGTTSPKVLSGGLVLTGVPGTGKSAIAFETARYAAQLLPSIKLLDVSCTSLIHKEVGGSERAIHQLFAAARKATPCILLMDGIDNIAAVRGNDATTEGTMDRVLSTLLVELDGVDDYDDALGNKDPNQGIAVIGITHNVNWIDPALLRPGRLAKVVELQLPDKDTRQRIVQRELERIKTPFVIVDHNDGVNHDDNDDAETSTGTTAATRLIVHATTGMAASSVVAICNDLKLWLARNNNEEVHGTDKIQIRRETIDSLIRSRK